MPLYEYECSQCHRHTEKIQKFSDPEITECPYCGGKLERTLTAPNVQFKGGGWYKDLYSSAKPPAANAGGGDSAKSGDSGSSASGSSSSEGSSPGSSSTSDSSSTPAPASAPAAASAPSSPAPTSSKS